MARIPKTPKADSRQAEPEVEFQPDAWERFERFIKEVAKKPPQHRKARPNKNEKAPS